MLDIWRGILQFRANFLSLYKIGCGSGKKTEQAHFFPLTLRYLYIRQAASWQNNIKQA